MLIGITIKTQLCMYFHIVSISIASIEIDAALFKKIITTLFLFRKK